MNNTGNAYRCGLYHMLIRLGANVLMIGAVCVGMYHAHYNPEAALVVFCQWFFGLTIPVWAFAFWLTRRVKRRFSGEQNMAGSITLSGRKEGVWKIIPRGTQS